MDPALPRDGRRPLLAEPTLDQHENQEGAERVLPGPHARDVHRRSDRYPGATPGRRGQHGVVDRLPAPGKRLSVLAQGDRRALRQRAHRRASKDRLRQRRAVLETPCVTLDADGCTGLDSRFWFATWTRRRTWRTTSRANKEFSSTL